MFQGKLVEKAYHELRKGKALGMLIGVRSSLFLCPPKELGGGVESQETMFWPLVSSRRLWTYMADATCVCVCVCGGVSVWLATVSHRRPREGGIPLHSMVCFCIMVIALTLI